MLNVNPTTVKMNVIIVQALLRVTLRALFLCALLCTLALRALLFEARANFGICSMIMVRFCSRAVEEGFVSFSDWPSAAVVLPCAVREATTPKVVKSLNSWPLYGSAIFQCTEAESNVLTTKVAKKGCRAMTCLL